MTCCVLVLSLDSDCPPVEARAILDSASSASFISERLAQSLCLPRLHQSTKIIGVACLSSKSPIQSITKFGVTATRKSVGQLLWYPVSLAIYLFIIIISFDSRWNHLSDVKLADPDFGCPGKIDILLGVEVFVDVLLHGRRIGPPNSPVTFKTKFGLGASRQLSAPMDHVATHHVALSSGDDILCKFWEMEEPPRSDSALSLEERSVVQHFKDNHSHTPEGRFIVPLPKKP